MCFNTKQPILFARYVSDAAKVLHDQQATRDGGRFYEPKRDEAKILNNNCNMRLLLLCRAQILIFNSYQQ